MRKRATKGSCAGRKSLPQKLRKNRLEGESACPTKVQALEHHRGTDAFVCEPGDLSDCFTACYGRGSDWGVPVGPIVTRPRDSASAGVRRLSRQQPPFHH